MDNSSVVMIDIANSLKRIAEALEESNKMVRDLGGKE